MDDSGSGYTTDIVYPSAFGAFQSPAHLTQAAWMGGRATPRIDRPFTYADLGSGVGLTLCVLADCYPEAEFHGIDLNPEHIRRSRELAARAGLRNVTFHEASFADLARLPLPRLDFAGLSGIYSWLSPDLREACLKFLGQQLTADGAVFVHYAALPGNAQIDALYALIREVAEALPGDSVARFRGACAVVDRLRAVEARFFLINPQAAAWLEQIGGHDPRSMAHEVLNARRTSLSARDVADEAAQHGLAYVANAQLELNDLELTAPDALRNDLAALAGPAREMLLDAVRNTHSRMDLYMRAGPSAAAAPQMWVDRLTRGPLREDRARLSARLGLDLNGPAYDAILSSVDGQATPLATLIADPRLQGCETPPDRLVQRLAALKLIHLLAKPYAKAPSGRARMSSRLNELVLEEQIESAGPTPFASRVAGTQVLLPPQDRLALLFLMGGDFDAAWARLRTAGQSARMDGRAIGDAAALRDAARTRAEALGDHMLDQLGRLGIVA